MPTLAILPVKSFGRAKQRLGSAIGDRPQLAAAMVGDVLDALGAVRGLHGVIVVSAEDILEDGPLAAGKGGALAAGKGGAPAAGKGGAPAAGKGGPPAAAERGFNGGIEWVHDPLEVGQSSAAARGVRAAVARGASRVLLVPGDCPALDPAEVDELLATAGPGVVIVPDRHGSGTNALLLDPPTVIEPAFGPGSFARHAALAAGAGAVVRVGRLPSLELDIDTPGDLEALRTRGGGGRRTRALLDRLARVA
jgi:2-phospho-L-lactate/phosphoenolpyruvate guanylyltransferase